MKIISLLVMVYSLLLMSCGSRKTGMQKNEKQEQRTETKIELKDVFKGKVRAVRDSVYLERKIEAKQEVQQQKQRQKTSKKREYYENGTLKSELQENTIESELINQLTWENNHLKSSTEKLKEEKEELIKKEFAYQSEIHSLKEKNKAKKTEREAYPWYWWIIGGIIAWEGMKMLWRIYRSFKY